MSDKRQKKIDQIKKLSTWNYLVDEQKEQILKIVSEIHLTFQETRQVIDIVLDFLTWDESLDIINFNYQNKVEFLNQIKTRWEVLKASPHNYQVFNKDKRQIPEYKFVEAKSDSIILGKCPVASEKTRCCNLLTLDVVRNCGFDCNYCCIQSYFHDNEIIIEKNLKEKLDKLHFDKNQIYHIGTGQSSDSLMWGDKYHHLSDLCDFLKKHPNIILELKTKSANVAEFLKLDFPKNVICSWSLNPQVIIDNEERLTSSLNERMIAARKVADRGYLVGFHFHPMIYYQNWQADYSQIASSITTMFQSHELAMISFGTLTYIKPIIKKIRSRKFKSLVLKMPLQEIAGKYSYDKEIKLKLFKHLFNQFASWHNQVFFYLCMEEIGLWKEVFGFEYKSNEEFEKAMVQSYLKKIEVCQ